MINIRAQALILIVFAGLNAALFLFAANNSPANDINNNLALHPTFSNAPDGHRYWGVARNLVDGLGFNYQNKGTGKSHSLVRGGPLPPIIFFTPIKLFGTNGAAAAIVSIQCLLLYLTALIFWQIANTFGVPPTLTQILCLFNPILIISAHHAQSEIVFTFFLALFLMIGSTLVSSATNKTVNWGLLGFFVGCMYLARPASTFALIGITVIFLILTYSNRSQGQFKFREMLVCVSFFILSTLLTASPWLIRNALITPGNHLFLPLPNTATSINDNLIELLYYGDRTSNWGEYANPNKGETYSLVSKHLAKIDSKAVGCLSDVRSNTHNAPVTKIGFRSPTDPDCLVLINKAVILSILSQDIETWIKAGTRAVLVTLFAGGGSTLNRYLGLDKIDSEASTKAADILYSSILGLNFFFHVLAICGLLFYLKGHQSDRSNWLILFTICIFIASYGFIGNARFRVPLDPIFMLYASYMMKLCIAKYRRLQH